MWGRKKRQAPVIPEVPSDINEARQSRADTANVQRALRRDAPNLLAIANGLIERQGRNHYIETLYQYIPKEGKA